MAINISLGRNCEVASALIECNVPLESSLLNWADVLSETSLYRTIEDPMRIFSKGANLINQNMFRCHFSDIAFHGRYNFSDWENRDNAKDKEVCQALEELRSRSNHLACKLANQLANQCVNAFVKPPRNLNMGEYLGFPIRLRRHIDNTYPGNNVMLYIVSEGGEFSIASVDNTSSLYRCTISSYTHDGRSGQFSEQSLGEWKQLFSFACQGHSIG
jgi:hypothetical protein